MICLTLDPNAPLPLPQAGQPDSYPHTRLLLTQALRYAKEYASSYFYPILNQVALRLMCHPELEPKPGNPINRLVDEYLSQPLVIELRDLEQDENNILGAVAREDLTPGRPCILMQLADALEHSSVSECLVIFRGVLIFFIEPSYHKGRVSSAKRWESRPCHSLEDIPSCCFFPRIGSCSSSCGISNPLYTCRD